MDSGPMVLNVLINSRNEMDASLRFRRSCQEWICTSCAMNIDSGKGLACLTKIEFGAKMTMTPLLLMYVSLGLDPPVLTKNLVVDMTNFYNQCKSIEPWREMKNTTKKLGKEIRQTKKDRVRWMGKNMLVSFTKEKKKFVGFEFGDGGLSCSSME
ncbi:hypothetical protein ACLB2K_041362 [Fragaria x ananassa]